MAHALGDTTAHVNRNSTTDGYGYALPNGYGHSVTDCNAHAVPHSIRHQVPDCNEDTDPDRSVRIID